MSPAARPARAAPAPVRILIIDNNAAVAETLVDIAAVAGYEGSTVRNGPTALSLLARDPHDAVVCEFNLPVFNGARVFAEVEERHPSLRDRFLVMGTDPDDPAFQAFLARTRLPCLVKPFTVARALAAIAQIVA